MNLCIPWCLKVSPCFVVVVVVVVIIVVVIVVIVAANCDCAFLVSPFPGARGRPVQALDGRAALRPELAEIVFFHPRGPPCRRR